MLPPGHERSYTADFLIVEPITGLHVDVEVDESHSFSRRQAGSLKKKGYRQSYLQYEPK